MESNRKMNVSCISSLGSVSTTKLLCIEPNLNNICKENLCDMLTAHSDCPGDNISESTVINFENVASYCLRAPNYSNKHKVGSSASSGSLDDGNIQLKGALPTPNIWEKRPKFQKNLSYTEWWVDMSFQFTKAQRRLPIGARDGVGQEHGCVLYPQSLESESSTKPVDIELNQNNTHEENLCHKSNARGDCPLNENGSILMPDGPIQVAYLIEVPDKSLVDKTLRKTNNQSKLLKNDCLGSHLGRAELNYSNTEQPLFESTSSSGKESVLTIYPDKLGSEFFESRDNISVCSTIIHFEDLASYCLRAPKYSNRHKDGSLASCGSFDDGNIHVKESSRKKEPFSLKRSNDSSVSISCKKQKITEEIGAQVLSALSEGSISASSSLIDLNTPDLKISHIDTQKMPLTRSPADPECWQNVIVPPSDHPDIVSLKGNFPLISKHTDGNKCTLERDDAQNISFLETDFINRNESLKRTHMPDCNLNDGMSEINTYETRKVIKYNIIPCDVKKRDCSPEYTKEIISKGKHIIPFESSSFTHRYAISGKPLKLDRSKLKKLRNNSKEKVTDLMSEESSVCLENNIFPKHINRPSDLGLYLMNESEQSIDKGEKQPNKQRRYNSEEVENNVQKISEILEHENRTKPSTPISMISTESNSQLSKLKSKSNSDIFKDVSSSEDIFTLSNKVNKNRVHASSNYSPHFDKPTKSRYLEHEKKETFFKTFKNIRSHSVDLLKSKNGEILTSPSEGKEIIFSSRKKRILSGKIVNQYAIGDKPLKSHRSKLNKLRNKSREKVTDLMSEESSVCLENNIVPKHINRLSDSELYLMNESEQSIDKGGKQPNKQRRSTCEEVEKNDQKISKILDHEDRTKPSTPNPMISTKSNSQLCKLKDKLNNDIFKDVSSSEDIFTLSNRVNKIRVHASSNYSPHFNKPKISCNLEHEKREKFFKTFKNIRSHSVDLLKSKNCEILTSPSEGKGIIICSRERGILSDKILNRYAIGDKPLKSHRSKLNKLKKKSTEKVTDLMSEESSVCLENSIVPKHINRPSDSGLYLMNETEQSIDKGEKQPKKQRRYTCEEVEKNDQKISKILDHEDRTKPSTLNPMISTESNSQLSKLKDKLNNDIFKDVSSSEDIFTLSDKVNKNRVHASSNYSPHFNKPTKSCNLEYEKRKKFFKTFKNIRSHSVDLLKSKNCEIPTSPSEGKGIIICSRERGILSDKILNRYAIGDKPLKSHRSKLNKLKKNSTEKVTDLMSEESSVCLENNIVPKHINRPSDSGLYLMNETEQSIDIGEKQPNKQRRSTCEEVEKNDQKISKILDHEDRTKPSTPNPMISTKSNSELSKLKDKLNNDIFKDVSSSEDIFTLSDKVNKNRVHASSNYSPHFNKPTKSCNLEHEKREKIFKTFKNIRSHSVDLLKSNNCEILTSPSEGKGIIICSRERGILSDKILNRYAIGDKPLKSHRSKLNKLKNKSREKVTDLMSEESSVCLENNIFPKHINKPSDSGLYLMNETEQSIDKGEKQPNKQRRSTCEEVEKNAQKISKILDHEDRTKPSTPITMISTEINSLLSKLKDKSNNDIFKDVSSSEDIFTLSNKANKNRVHASSNYSPHFNKPKKSCNLEHEKREKLVKTFKNIRSHSVDLLKSKNCEILTSPSEGKGIITCSREKRILSDKILNRYAIGDKPLKSHRSKLNKLKKKSREKVNDLMSEESSVCLENNFFPKHINRPSDFGLYLMNESEQSIDKGENQPKKQRRFTCEEVEKNDQKISELVDHEDRTKPSTPITMISTESNSQLSKLKDKSNNDIFKDVSSSEDIFTLSNKVNKNRVHASNYSPHFNKPTKSCNLEHEKREKFFKTFKNIRSHSVDLLKSKNCEILTSPSEGKGIIICSRERGILSDKILNRYAIGDKPLKSHRSKLNKLKKKSTEKVTDLMSEESSVCLENNIVPKHINRPSDSGLYLMNETEQSIDKGEKQPNKQRRSTYEEVEKNDQKISEILDHEDRTKPSTPITMISTEINSLLSKLKDKSNNDIFKDVSSSEDIFTLSNKANKNRVHASSNYSPHFNKPKKSCNLEHEKREKLVKTFKNIRSHSVDLLKSKNCEILTSPLEGKGIIFCSRERGILSDKILNRYAIGDKPLKSHRSKLNKTKKKSREKVTDLMSEESSVCLENNIFPKHINRPSDLGLYLMNESEQSIDKGGKQPNKQRRSTCEEVEKNDQKISEILDHENRTKLSNKTTMVSTGCNSRISKLKCKSNINIFTDISSSEDIFTVSKSILNRHSKQCIQASANSSSKGRLIEKQSLKIISSVPEKLTKSRYLEEETRKEFVLALEKLYTGMTNKGRSDDSFTTFVCKEKTPPVTLFHSKTEMIVDNTNSSGSKEVLDSSRAISSCKNDCKKHVERREKSHSEDKIDLTHSSTIPSLFQNKSSDEDNFPLIQYCNRNMQGKLQNTIFKTRLSVTKSSPDEYTSQTKENRNKVSKTKPRDVPVKQSFTSGSKTEFKLSPSKKKKLCVFECFSTDEEIKPFKRQF